MRSELWNKITKY